MRVRYDSQDEAIDTAVKSTTVRIDTGKGSIIVGVFDDEFQAIRIEGDKATTWIKFNGQSLV